MPLFAMCYITNFDFISYKNMDFYRISLDKMLVLLYYLNDFNQNIQADLFNGEICNLRI